MRRPGVKTGDGLLVAAPVFKDALLSALALPLSTCVFGGFAQVDVLFYARYPGKRDEVVLTTRRRVVLSQFNAGAGVVHVIRSANVATVGAEDREMFFDVG